MAGSEITVCKLRRYDTGQPWGFKMQGGSEVRIPLQVAEVSPKSVAGKAGLRDGDLICYINKAYVADVTHQHARNEMIRAGNDIDMTIKRPGGVGPKTAGPLEKEDSIDDNYRDVQPKTYQILQTELPQAAAAGGRPASIFDKKKKARSEYTKTEQSGYTKAYGQS
ncbi:PDZ and LIM domain protein 3-like [Mytilus edulis]|uniref:PDZ and LIM domain protein 3-like n=1 Tax=Mytilus edulis TaxID=6550 RepID=UPI0039EE747E